MKKWRHRIAALAVAGAAVAAPMAVVAPAHASPWDPHVLVLGSVSSCGPSKTAGWGWFSSSTGESGWLTWGNGSTFTFNLYKVPSGSPAYVNITWGVGTCQHSADVGVSRPLIGSNAPVGWLG
jgi:hypothetical protein